MLARAHVLMVGRGPKGGGGTHSNITLNPVIMFGVSLDPIRLITLLLSWTKEVAGFNVLTILPFAFIINIF